MTNEKAREILQQIRKQKCVSECESGCKLYEHETFCLEEKALDIAIKALEQESITWIIGKDNCQVAVRNMPIDKMKKICVIIGDEEQWPCEDCVSYERVKQLFLVWAKKQESNIKSLESISKFFAMLDALPSVTPSRPKGKWILYHPLQEDDPGAYMCSVCKYGDWGLDPKIDKFCFNCGADMRESEDE